MPPGNASSRGNAEKMRGFSLPCKFRVIIPPPDSSPAPGCIEDFISGDAVAFEKIYKSYSGRVYDYALLISANETVSEDMVQDVFLRLWQLRHNLEGVNNFNAYLLTITRNLVYSYFRKKNNSDYALRDLAYLRGQFPSVNTLSEPEIDRQQLLEYALQRLPQRQQQVYELKRSHKLKEKEIAAALKISIFTVKNHTQSGLKFIKKYMLEHIEKKEHS